MTIERGRWGVWLIMIEFKIVIQVLINQNLNSNSLKSNLFYEENTWGDYEPDIETIRSIVYHTVIQIYRPNT